MVSARELTLLPSSLESVANTTLLQSVVRVGRVYVDCAISRKRIQH